MLKDADTMLNELCRLTTRSNTLNAFHACREGHPLGRDNAWKRRNAYALARQDADLLLVVNYHTLDWLKAQANAEQS